MQRQKICEKKLPYHLDKGVLKLNGILYQSAIGIPMTIRPFFNTATFFNPTILDRVRTTVGIKKLQSNFFAGHRIGIPSLLQHRCHLPFLASYKI